MRKIYLVLFIFLGACSDPIPMLEFQVKEDFINIADSIPGDWDKACILVPYTLNSVSVELTGLDESEINKTGIEVLDGYNVLILLKNDEKFGLYKFTLKSLEYASLHTGCFSKLEAKQYYVGPRSRRDE